MKLTYSDNGEGHNFQKHKIKRGGRIIPENKYTQEAVENVKKFEDYLMEFYNLKLKLDSSQACVITYSLVQVLKLTLWLHRTW